MKKRINGIDITYNVDRYLDEVLEKKEYSFLNYYPTIIDIGANIGTFSLSMYEYADKIFAIEPAEKNIDCLKQTIADNNLTKIIPIKMAISDRSYIQTMVRNGDPGMGGWRLDKNGDYPVDTRTLLDFMNSQNIEYVDLVKIDVEGEEENILKAPFFPKDRIGTIIGEWHMGRDKIVKDLLEWYGFKYFALPGNHFLARKV